MGFKVFVQVGRAVLIAKGPETGKLGVVVEIVSEKSVLIDGPTNGASRQVISVSHLTLLPIVLPKFPRGARSGTVAKKWANADVENKFEKTRHARQMVVRGKRSGLSDFQRFVVARLKKQRSVEVRKVIGKIRKE